MTPTENLTGLFNALDLSFLAEFILVAAGASLLILLLEKSVPWLANKFSGKRRLYLLSSVPLIRLSIIALTMVYIIPKMIEPTLQNMVALLGTIGLAIGFALKDYASSLVAGIAAVNEMLYRPGDWIEVNDVYGEVLHIGTRTVTVVTADDTEVAIPHAKLWSESVHNANSGGPHLMCVAHFYLHPEHDANLVKQALHDVALTSPFVQLKKPIVVTVQEMPHTTQYRLKAYPIDLRQQFRFSTDLTVRGKQALQRLGVKFATVPWL
jgi:small conductance mechanosensitive channel